MPGNITEFPIPTKTASEAATDLRNAVSAAKKATTGIAKKAFGGFGFLAQPNASDTVTVGSVTYTFVSGSPAAPNQVQIAATSILTANNLRAAINDGSGGGVTHPDFVATSANGVVGLLAKVAGAAKNGLATTSSAPSRVLAYQSATYGGTDASVSLSPDEKFPDDVAYKNPLDIPTFDGLPSVTHPSVVFHPKGWNGYRYWMAYTPWPDGSREFPCICASQNGVDWEVPTGLSNPLVDVFDVQAQPSGGASNFGFAPDTHLVMLDEDTMAVFFLMAWATGGSDQDAAVFRMTSTDGVTWGSLTRVIDTVANGRDETHGITSPTIFQKPDGTWEMFGVTEFDGPVKKISRWTSPDTTTWTWQNQMVFVEGAYNVWHLDAHFVAGKYHILAVEINGHNHYFTSPDGVNIYGDVRYPAPELISGDAFDAAHHYRSAMIPRHGSPLAWDVWVSGVPDNYDGAFPGGNPWLIGLYKNVVFGDPAPAAQLQNQRRLMPLATGMTYQSGTGASASLLEGSMFRCSQGSTAAGYAMARLSRRTDTRESNNTNFSRPFAISGKVLGGASAGTKARILYGAVITLESGYTANAHLNPFSAKGIGLEFGTDATNQKIRLVYHDGTTAKESDWFDLGSTIHFVRSYAYRMVNYGNGTLALFAAGGTTANAYPKILLPEIPSIRVTDGPTGAGGNVNNSAIWALVTGDGTTTPGIGNTMEFEAPLLEWL